MTRKKWVNYREIHQLKIDGQQVAYVTASGEKWAAYGKGLPPKTFGSLKQAKDYVEKHFKL